MLTAPHSLLFFYFAMWYIIKTDYYKERDAIKDLLRLDSIADIYFPNSRPNPTDIGWEKSRPTTSGPKWQAMHTSSR